MLRLRIYSYFGVLQGGVMRILGIDPGYAIMGYGILDYKGNKFTPVEYGSITTEAHTPNEERLLTLYTELTRIIEEYRPDEAAIEELFYNTNATTAIMVGEARGMALLACAQSASFFSILVLLLSSAVIFISLSARTEL